MLATLHRERGRRQRPVLSWRHGQLRLLDCTGIWRSQPSDPLAMQQVECMLMPLMDDQPEQRAAKRAPRCVHDARGKEHLPANCAARRGALRLFRRARARVQQNQRGGPVSPARPRSCTTLKRHRSLALVAALPPSAQHATHTLLRKRAQLLKAFAQRAPPQLHHPGCSCWWTLQGPTAHPRPRFAPSRSKQTALRRHCRIHAHSDRCPRHQHHPTQGAT